MSRFLTLIVARQDPANAQAIDEYGIIQLQNLAMKPDDDEKVRDHGDLVFEWQPDDAAISYSDHDLWRLANARLAWLERRCDVEQLCAIKDIIRRFEIQPEGSTRAPVLPRDLKNLCVSIENEAMISAAELANTVFGHDEGEGGDEAGLEGDPSADLFPAIPGKPLAHHAPENRINRALLALAGVATGVPDFPWQDKSEVHDSTTPAMQDVDFVMYVHPKFTVEIVRDWRSFQHSRKTLGNCPYLHLMWLACLHDELIVESIEQGIDEMVFGAATKGARYRIMAMADVDQIRRQSRRLLGRSGNNLLERNLQRRLDLFRFSSIHRSGKIFRYPREKDGLDGLLETKGITERFERADKLIDRIEGLVEDVTTVKSAFAERRTNIALAVIAVFGVIGTAGGVAEMYVGKADRPLVTGLITAGVIAAVVFFLFWTDLRQRRRD